MTTPDFSTLRQRMLADITAEVLRSSEALGKTALDARVMAAMASVPRDEFVRFEQKEYAYENRALPIGFDKTISQPFIVAVMTDLLEIRPTDCVLEIGTGLGYQAAVLAQLARQVYSIELFEELAMQARRRLARLGYDNVDVRIGNGVHGWPDHAPFDKVIATAAPALIPPALIYQLKPGGRMVIPAGLADSQQLLLVEKDLDGSLSTREILPVLFSQLDDADTV